MKRLVVALSAVAVALGSTDDAGAKELASFKVCGAAGCKAITSPGVLRSLIRALESQGEPVSTTTPALAPYYRLEFSIKGDEGMTPSFTQYYARSLALISMEPNPGGWTWVKAGPLQKLLANVTAGVKPFAPPRIAKVTVGGKPVSDPGSYSTLFTFHKPTDDYPDDGDWIRISIATARPSPWSTGAATLEYSPSKNTLWRGAEFIEVPSDLASQLEARKSLNETPEKHSLAWIPVLGVLALVLSAAVVLQRRRSR